MDFWIPRLALLKTVPRPEPQVKTVRFANPPPASWLSGELGDNLKTFYAGAEKMEELWSGLLNLVDHFWNIRNDLDIFSRQALGPLRIDPRRSLWWTMDEGQCAMWRLRRSEKENLNVSPELIFGVL